MSIRSSATPRAVSEKAPRHAASRAKRPPAPAAKADDAPRAADLGRLRWQAYERFQQQIVASRIRPGQFVSQRELAALMDLPLGAIREVIPRLEAEGLLQTAPQRGLQIATVDVKLVRNAFQLRLMIEREAAGQFSLTATDAELDSLEATPQRDRPRCARRLARSPG